MPKVNEVNDKCVDKRKEHNEQKFQRTRMLVQQINVQLKLDLQKNIS